MWYPTQAFHKRWPKELSSEGRQSPNNLIASPDAENVSRFLTKEQKYLIAAKKLQNQYE